MSARQPARQPVQLSSGRRLAMIVVNGFVATTAIGGGVALAAGWEADRFPTTWLASTPFDSYVVPGVLLTTVVGGSAAVATSAAVRRTSDAPRASVVAGAAMVGWVAAEVALLPRPARSYTEALYLGAGVVMCLLGAARRPRTRASSAAGGEA